MRDRSCFKGRFPIWLTSLQFGASMNPQIKIKVRPNNQIVVTCGNYRSVAKSPHQRLQNLHDRVPIKKVLALSETISNAREMYESKRDIYEYRLAQPLDIIQKSQRTKKRTKSRINTPKSFSRHSGQKIRECGAAMQIQCGDDPRFCHEVTLTLPANHRAAFETIAKYSWYIINRLTQLIRRDYGDSILWFFVWEYQKRGALHLHFCIYHPDESEGLWLCTRLIDLWHKILIDISDDSGIDMFLSKQMDRCTIRQNHQHHSQPIQKDVGRYFAKYAGKTESKSSWYCQSFPVSRFWGSSKTIKMIINQNSVECSWDYFANTLEQEKKMTEIIESILTKLNIVSVSSYEFSISLEGKHRLNQYKNGRKILSVDEDKIIASGIRYTFYCPNNKLKDALRLVNEQANYF